MRNMKAVLAAAAIAVLAGCGSASQDSSQEQKQEDKGYLGTMMDINKQSQDNINKAVEEQNKKLNDALDQTGNSNNTNNMDYAKKYSQAEIATSLGKLTVKFEVATAPKTVNNFLKLASEKFYDGTKFHRVIKDFMIQGGDPLSKDDSKKALWGTGGPGYMFNDELSGKETYPQGTLAMANSGPNTNGSQFFIVTASPGYPLPPKYTVFGHVVSGLDTALKIQGVETGPNDRPTTDVVIESITPVASK